MDYAEFSSKVCAALRATFTDLLAANPDQTFYTFALWTDDSLQFATAAANTEAGLVATVEHYKAEVDPKYGTTSTRNSMRWAHGDWKFFPVDDTEGHLSEINAVLQSNCDAEEEVFDEHIGPLWEALFDGFLELEKDGFFGSGESRSKVTLLLVGDLSEEIIYSWATALNPPDVAAQYINWDWEEPDEELDG